MSVSAEDIHAFLLENQAEGAEHDSVACAICVEKASKQEGNVSAENMLTQEQHEQLLASAVEKASTEAAALVDAEVLTLNEQLEEAKSALTTKDEEIASLKATIDERTEDDRLDVLADERVDQVKAIAAFSDEQVKSRRLGWAKMDEDGFKAYLEDIELAAKSTVSEGDAPKTKLDGTRETAGDKGSETSVVAEFLLADTSVAATL